MIIIKETIAKLFTIISNRKLIKDDKEPFCMRVFDEVITLRINKSLENQS